MRTRMLVGAVVAVAVVVAAVGIALAIRRNHAEQVRLDQCEQVRTLAQRLPSPPARPQVAVLGDSYAEGMTLPDPSQAWPFHAFPSVAVNAIGGTGFVSGGPCDGQSFSSRAAKVLAFHAPTVILQGGLNDLGATSAQETAAAAKLARVFTGSGVFIIGPSLAPARDASQVRRIDAALATAARQVGATYISTLSWRLSYGPDGVHPTAASALVYAQRVRAAAA